MPRSWILIGAAGFGAGALVLVVLSLVGYFVLRSKSNADGNQIVQSGAQPVEQADTQPDAGPPPVEVPDGPMPAQLDAATLGKVKRATVYLRVNLPNGSVAQGSGFLSLVPGIVVTNAHVLGMLRGNSTPPVRVEVVVHSGEPGEKKLVGTVLGVDRTNDLAVLRVPSEGLPTPLAVDSANKLFETQKVYIFGFPLGVELGKNITVSESSVSSLRRDDAGALSQVQINGGMHPGNSGGPVTDARGVVVGVSVAIIEGTQINFAIPGDLVKQVLDGRFDRSELGTAYQSDDNQVKLPVKMTCLDPLNRIRQMKIDMWIGDGPHTTLPAVFHGGAHTVDVPLPKPAPGQVCWLQPAIIKASGATEWQKAVAVPVEAQTAIERRPALLQFQPPTVPTERTLKTHNAVTVTIYKGNKSGTLIEKMEGTVLESLNPDQRGNGTFIRLTLGNCPFSQEVANKKRVPPSQAQVVLSQYSPTFLVDASNAAKERGKRNFQMVVPQYRDTVESMYETMCNTYESTTLPLPNRTVQPLETWKARMPLFVLIDGKRQLQDIFVTCTYEGVRSVAGRDEATIGLTGLVKGRGPRAALVLGKARGQAHFDVEKGFFTLVALTVSSEVENEEAGVRILVNKESTVRRSEGNSSGLTAATRNQPGGMPGLMPMPRGR